MKLLTSNRHEFEALLNQTCNQGNNIVLGYQEALQPDLSEEDTPPYRQ